MAVTTTQTNKNQISSAVLGAAVALLVAIPLSTALAGSSSTVAAATPNTCPAVSVGTNGTSAAGSSVTTGFTGNTSTTGTNGTTTVTNGNGTTQVVNGNDNVTTGVTTNPTTNVLNGSLNPSTLNGSLNNNNILSGNTVDVAGDLSTGNVLDGLLSGVTATVPVEGVLGTEL